MQTGEVALCRLVYTVLGGKVKLRLKQSGCSFYHSGHSLSLVGPGVLRRKLNIYWYFDLFVF